jgi:hypothetical protein
MQTDTAYFFGILIGGGKLSNTGISIEFPYKLWPHEDFRISPQWFNDSVTKIIPLIKNFLNTNAVPRYVDANTPRFSIEIDSTPQILYEMLRNYGIRPIGELRRDASIEKLVKDMDVECKKSFISGFADVVGSCRASHRNHTIEATIISFEVVGDNWKLPYELCQTFHDIGIPVDQILWNHPNMHAGKTPTAYWKKGHKIRVKAGDFSKIGYGLECKRNGLNHLLTLEKEARGYISEGRMCPNRDYRINGRKVYHLDEKSDDLPDKVKGHFIHYTDICRALGCPHAPSYWLDEKYSKYS